MQVGLPEWLVAMATRDASDHTAAVGALYRRLAEQLAGTTSGEATTGERFFFFRSTLRNGLATLRARLCELAVCFCSEEQLVICF